jgi:hypothetical protein
MSQTAELAVREMPLMTRAHILEEGAHDPGFWPRLAEIAASPNPGRAVDDDMKRAIINELEPSRYRDSGRRWPVLKSKMRTVMTKIGQHYAAHGNLDGLADELPTAVVDIDAPAPAPTTEQPLTFMPPAQPTEQPLTFMPPAQPQAAPAPAPAPAAAPSSGPSIWASIASALSTAGQAAAKVYATSIQISAQKDVAKIQQQTAAQVQATQQATAQALAARQAASSSATTSYIMYGLVGLIGVGGLVMLAKVFGKKK